MLIIKNIKNYQKQQNNSVLSDQISVSSNLLPDRIINSSTLEMWNLYTSTYTLPRETLIMISSGRAIHIPVKLSNQIEK